MESQPSAAGRPPEAGRNHIPRGLRRRSLKAKQTYATSRSSQKSEPALIGGMDYHRECDNPRLRAIPLLRHIDCRRRDIDRTTIGSRIEQDNISNACSPRSRTGNRNRLVPVHRHGPDRNGLLLLPDGPIRVLDFEYSALITHGTVPIACDIRLMVENIGSLHCSNRRCKRPRPGQGRGANRPGNCHDHHHTTILSVPVSLGPAPQQTQPLVNAAGPPRGRTNIHRQNAFLNCSSDVPVKRSRDEGSITAELLMRHTIDRSGVSRQTLDSPNNVQPRFRRP